MTVGMVVFGEKTDQDAIQMAWRAIQETGRADEVRSAA